MKLSEIISYLNLTIYPSIGLVFFLVAFLAILVKVLRQPREESDAIANMPLNDDVVSRPRHSIKAHHQDKGDAHA